MSAAAAEQLIQQQVAQFVYDPLGFVLWAFPWGQPGDLENETGPDVWQAQQLKDIGDTFLEDPEATLQEAIASGHGIGKVQANQVLVETPAGQKRWGSVEVGDLLFGADGRPTTVLKKFKHKNWPFYRVTFDDGSSTLCGPEHLWNVRGRQERRKQLDGWRTMTTQEILDAGVKRPNGASLARQWEIPTQGAAHFEGREVDLHPYLVGLWLGDGARGLPTYCKPYPEITEKLRGLGYEVHTSPCGAIHRVNGICHLLTHPVFQCGSHDRYIPEDYKYNTVESRRALLEGLLDTDGEVHASGSIGYSSTSEKLVEDVIWLVRSLGGRATRQPAVKQGWYPDPKTGERVECQPCYRATINIGWNPFTLQHRRARYKPSEDRYRVRWVDSIEFSHYEDGHCVVVEAEDHLYLTNDFIVTHNSTEVAWIILWAMSTRPHLAGWVTANTQAQLKSKTWRELAVWHKRAKNKRWFEWTATRFFQVDNRETWGLDAIPWSEHNSEAFAGLHARYVLMIMDEASAIADKIWEVAEGAMTTPRAMWFCFGNPTKNTGRFRECFGKYRHRWRGRQIDSRSCKMTNKVKIQEWLEDHGEDSDFFRVRVRGEFPRFGTNQLIPGDDVARARAGDLGIDQYIHFTKVLGVDVARFGSDETVFTVRQGRKVYPQKVFRGLNNIQVGARASALAQEEGCSVIMVDEAGLGSGVVDYLATIGAPVVGVQAGAKADDDKQFYNKRAEMWWRMKQWLEGEVDIPDDPALADQLIALEYEYDLKERVKLEKKEDLAERLPSLGSPDRADSLALTFAEIVAPQNMSGSFEPEPEPDDY